MHRKSTSPRLRSLGAKRAMALASAWLVAMIHSDVLAQADEVPDFVVITGSLFRGPLPYQPVPFPGRLHQLTTDELSALLPGSVVSIAEGPPSYPPAVPVIVENPGGRPLAAYVYV